MAEWTLIMTIIGVIVAIVGIIIPIYINKQSKLPKLLIFSTINGTAPSDHDDETNASVLNGYFKTQRDFDKKIIDFFEYNNYKVDFECQHLLNQICKEYINKDFLKDSSDYFTKNMRQAIKTFENNPKFIKIINNYLAYQKHSRWILKIKNVGNSDAIDFAIDYFSENNSGAYLRNGTLKKDCEKKVIIYYFDLAMIIDNDNLCYWKNNISTIFYLVEEKKWNKKDERLFLITYDDIFGKFHKIYCCAKVGKNKKLNIMGAD